MTVRIMIPAPLRRFTEGLPTLEVTATSVADLLSKLQTTHPRLSSKLCDEQGRVRHFVTIHANNRDIRHLDRLATVLEPGDEVTILPAIGA